MTPKERVIAALEHREPDRVPVGELAIDFEMTEHALGRPTLYRAKWKEYVATWNGRRDDVVASYGRDIVDLVRHFDLDYLAIPLVPARKSQYEPPEFLDEYTYRDADGRIWQYSPESGGHAMVVQPIEMGIDDIVMPPDPAPIDESRLEAIEYVVKELGGTHFIMGRVLDGAFPWAEADGTLDVFLMKMLDDPAFVERMIERYTREAVAYAGAMIDIGCDAVSPDGDFCDNRGPSMGPQLFHHFCFPSIKRQAEAIHARGGFDVKHSDGNTWLILDDFIEAGVDGWQGIQPRVGMDLKLLKERYGDKLCFFGGVDVDTLVAGTPDDVAEQVRYAVQHAGRGGGLVIGCGNTIMPGVKPENFAAMLQAARDVGTYPLRV
jgi:hypothetical protein